MKGSASSAVKKPLSLNLFDQSFFLFTSVNPGSKGYSVANSREGPFHISLIFATFSTLERASFMWQESWHRQLWVFTIWSLQLRESAAQRSQRKTDSCFGYMPMPWTNPCGQGTSAQGPGGTRSIGLPTAGEVKATLEPQGYRGQECPSKKCVCVGGRGCKRQGRRNNLYPELQTT